MSWWPNLAEDTPDPPDPAEPADPAASWLPILGAAEDMASFLKGLWNLFNSHDWSLIGHLSWDWSVPYYTHDVHFITAKHQIEIYIDCLEMAFLDTMHSIYSILSKFWLEIVIDM